MKVGIIIIVYNLPTDVFLLQMEAIKKFCKDDYEIEIIDNSTSFDVSHDIEYHSRELGLGYKKTFASSQNGSDSHYFAARLSYQMFRDSFDIICYIDHDVIPVKPFSFVEILGEDKMMAGLGQGGSVTYYWAGLVLWRNDLIDKDLVDLGYCHEKKIDTGGNTYKLIEKYGKENCIFFNESYHENPDYVGKYNHYAMLNDGMFIHFVGASNWIDVPTHKERINSLINITKEKAGL